jgi:hypothetical protein
MAEAGGIMAVGFIILIDGSLRILTDPIFFSWTLMWAGRGRMKLSGQRLIVIEFGEIHGDL